MLLHHIRSVKNVQRIASMVLLGLLLMLPVEAWGNIVRIPHSIQREINTVAIYYRGRVCPFSEFSHDIVADFHGRPGYKGLSAPEVVSGLMFYTEDWADEPILWVHDKTLRQVVGARGGFASYNGFKEALDAGLVDIKTPGWAADVHRFQTLEGLIKRHILLFYPLANDQGKVKWYSAVGDAPEGISEDYWNFIQFLYTYVRDCIQNPSSHKEAISKLHQLRHLQCKADKNIPSLKMIKVHHVYWTWVDSLSIPSATIALGLLMLVSFIWMPKMRKAAYWVSIAWLAFVWITALILVGLRWYIAGEVSFSGEYMTYMTGAMIVPPLAAVISIWLDKALPIGLVLTGICMVGAPLVGSAL